MLKNLKVGVRFAASSVIMIAFPANPADIIPPDDVDSGTFQEERHGTA